MNFADALMANITRTGSVLLAGCDPVLSSLPAFLHQESERVAKTDSQYVQHLLDQFTDLFLAGLHGMVPAVKPNVAFYEQYGLAGLAAFARFCERAQESGFLVISDAKRGDIGSTAAAYATAWLGEYSVRGRHVRGFRADAVTVNPFLGFDTLEPFVKVCKEYGRGIFVLVQTSNPGAKNIQGVESDSVSVSERIAHWLAERAGELAGECGWSGLGAVVGATYPQDGVALRKILPRNLFLIPGYGAQGGSAADAVVSFVSATERQKEGGLVNASRALLDGIGEGQEASVNCIRRNAQRLSDALVGALATTSN